MSEGVLRGWKDVPEEFRIEEMERYLGFLEESNEKGGFFSSGDADRILERHLKECALFVDRVVEYASVSRETTVLDAGTGPGLPGYLFYCLRNPPRLTLNDSSRRRLSLLEEWHGSRIAPSGDGGVRFSYARLEEMKGQFDLITSRALIPFPSVLRLIAHLQKPGNLYVGFFASIQPEKFEEVIRDCGYSHQSAQEVQATANEPVRQIHYFRKKRTVRQGKPFAWKFIRNEMSQWQKS